MIWRTRVPSFSAPRFWRLKAAVSLLPANRRSLYKTSPLVHWRTMNSGTSVKCSFSFNFGMLMLLRLSSRQGEKASLATKPGQRCFLLLHRYRSSLSKPKLGPFALHLPSRTPFKTHHVQRGRSAGYESRVTPALRCKSPVL